MIGNYFPMESFEKAGITGFTKSFDSAIFAVKNIKYHENGRISKIDFERIK